MNVFDFDKTIYHGNSIVHFYWWLLGRHPKLWPSVFKILWYGLLYGLRKHNIRWQVEHIYASFVPYVDINAEAVEFWQTEGRKRLKKWYRQVKKSTDVISTASPEFLIAPIAKELGVQMIGTPINPKTGKFEGTYNRGGGKVKRLKEKFGNGVRIECFYSDSHIDTPLVKLAKKAFWVDGETVKPWPEVN